MVPEDPQDADPALVDAVGRDTAGVLRTTGYAVKPVYTGQRGGFLVDVVIPFLTTVWTQKEVILADMSALFAILSAAVSVGQYLRKAYEKRVGKDALQQAPIIITAEVDGAPISIEVPDLESAEGALNLVRRFQAQHPAAAAKVTPQSTLKIKGRVPKRQSRKK